MYTSQVKSRTDTSNVQWVTKPRGTQRTMVLVVNFSYSFIIFCCFVVAIFDLVHACGGNILHSLTVNSLQFHGHHSCSDAVSS